MGEPGLSCMGNGGMSTMLDTSTEARSCAYGVARAYCAAQGEEMGLVSYGHK